MHMLTTTVLPTASAALLKFTLSALGPDQPRLLRNSDLPGCALECLEHNLVLAATTIMDPLFNDTLVRFTAATKRDVLLIRHGFHPDAGDAVRVDVAVRTIAGPLLIDDMRFFRHADGGLHLLPAKPDLFVEVGVCGLDLSMLPPWDRWNDRGRGIERAAAEICAAITGRSAWTAPSLERGA